MNNIITIFLLVFANYSFAQVQLSWKDLEDVEFSDLYVQELDEYVPVSYTHLTLPTILLV